MGLLSKVSARSLRHRKWVKVPMRLSVLSSALQSGISIVLVKLLSTLGFSGDDFDENKALVIFLAVIVIASASLQVHLLQYAIKYYDQMEVMPIYQTITQIVWIFTGLFIFDESQLYSSLQLLGFFGSILICCIGVGFLLMKSKKLEKNKWKLARDAVQMSDLEPPRRT